MGAAPPPPAAASPGSARLQAAAREARDDAAPFALSAAAILIALALVAKHADWESLGHSLWWMWLLVAAPYVVLAATLLLGLKRLVRHDHRREIVIARIKLADDRLSRAQRAELWQIVDCREWCLKMLVEDFPDELERIDREIENELRR